MYKNIVIPPSSLDASESLQEMTLMYLKQECLQMNLLMQEQVSQ